MYKLIYFSELSGMKIAQWMSQYPPKVGDYVTIRNKRYRVTMLDEQKAGTIKVLAMPE